MHTVSQSISCFYYTSSDLHEYGNLRLKTTSILYILRICSYACMRPKVVHSKIILRDPHIQIYSQYLKTFYEEMVKHQG